MKTTEIGRIVEQLKQAHEGEAWHGPSLREALDGVTARQAAARPIAAGHSIWEIVHHVRFVEESVRAHLTGEAAPQGSDWPATGETSEKAWRAALDGLAATRQALRDAAARLPESRLHENVPGASHSHWHELLGVLHHDLYHAGQISLLRKA
jgi:uncharacterized damage-inducible protein DinB